MEIRVVWFTRVNYKNELLPMDFPTTPFSISHYTNFIREKIPSCTNQHSGMKFIMHPSPVQRKSQLSESSKPARGKKKNRRKRERYRSSVIYPRVASDTKACRRVPRAKINDAECALSPFIISPGAAGKIESQARNRMEMPVSRRESCFFFLDHFSRIVCSRYTRGLYYISFLSIALAAVYRRRRRVYYR